MSEDMQAKIRAIHAFKQRTESESQEIQSRLLAPLDEVYEIDYGELIGTLHFRRMTLEDRLRLQGLTEKPEQLIETTCEILAKCSADSIPVKVWHDMAAGDRQPEFNKIAMNLLALSTSGPGGMVEFFRALHNRPELGSAV